MANVLQLLPELQGDEQLYVSGLIKDMEDNTAMQFAIAYRSRRRDPQMILLTALIGFLGVAGVHRFLVDNIGIGILYFFTGGLCLIGTIIDLINYKKLAFEYNQKQAHEVASMLSAFA